jgi:hypothetical protein
MAICVDPKLTYLNDLGYSVLRLPSQILKPLSILGVEGKARPQLLGTLDEIWTSEVPAPLAGPQQAAATISGFRTSDLKLSAGLDILGNVLNGMFGGAAPSVSAAYNSAKSVQFELGEVTILGITPLAIGNYIAMGELAGGNPFVRRYFGGQKDTRAMVVSQVLMAKSIKVTAKQDAGTAVNVDVPAIQAALGAKVGVTTGSSSGTEVTYENAVPLVFGFQVFEISYANGQWAVSGVAPGAAVAFADEESPDTQNVSRGELVEIDFSPTHNIE